ncbi:hypothetical protein BDK61_3128 [Haloarcula quadrata]|jgi:hypothetical protein|uniref:DUF447 family protein n=4 Tax=Haloarcula TaxID=2237 RepID=Q5V5R6_HALMA|nr:MULTISPECIES: DUF447 domain-containing protein [Haloarcula]AAV45136.1 unknown [Haloarcula marismortui ATCC 43049]EMA12630.1 hypothetical protein C436_12785 [Haloarcula sinaiiensis ATCC 33800]EMA21818.1 hypothetical protein C435_04298 [Haloarcula californiae ATCC 33799]NHX39013.1 DUF447 family protein [Haloarcula sp. R1-2]QCP92921.1 DUF447 family protein [Haloarcula marismortui ATCC 43049]
MTGGPSADNGPESGDSETQWPVTLAGVSETVVTTLGPNERWNVAALGVHAPDGDGPATATTWGRTRTWRNFRERGSGYVQFTRDPVDFAEAALSVREEDDPVIDSADAWVTVDVERRDSGNEGDTQWVEWALNPVDSTVERRVVPTTNRGHAAVVEATVAASRLDVPSYDRETLLDRLAYFESVVETAGGERERAAFERVCDLVDADW